jgi:hypothetical protein
MSYEKLAERLVGLIGADVSVTWDDGEAPSQIRLWRPDPIDEDLVRSAVGRAREEFPAEMAAISAVLVSYEGGLGRTGRRVALD